MKWPIIEHINEGTIRKIKVEYFTRITEWLLDTQECKICQQCIRACPKNALILPKFPKGVRVPRDKRVPIMPDPIECKFCGVCMALCPYNSISMKLNGQTLKIDDLQLSQAKILPKIKNLKVGRIELSEPDFSNAFWDKIVDQITIKRTIKKSE